jgi:molybdopterin-binding protein
VNAEVTIATASGLQVVAIVTQHALDELGLQVGAPVTALVKASDVVLAVVT